MTPRIKYLLLGIFVSLPFFWGVNSAQRNLEGFFLANEMKNSSKYFKAQLAAEKILEDLRPTRNSIADFELLGKAGISILVKNDGTEKILFEKNSKEVLPIASITKLMTAKVVINNYDLGKEITISKEAVMQNEDFGGLQENAVLATEYLLYPLLMESSNDAAFALANDYEGINEKDFILLMNQEAQNLGLENTFFTNPSGLDPISKYDVFNFSTAEDLAKLTKELIYEPFIWEILSTRDYSLFGPELKNNNELLSKYPEIIGGKTGFTESAGGCMVLLMRAPRNRGYVINVILGAPSMESRFFEMGRMIDWVKQAYKW